MPSKIIVIIFVNGHKNDSSFSHYLFFGWGEFIQYLFSVTFFSSCFHDAQRAGGLA